MKNLLILATLFIAGCAEVNSANLEQQELQPKDKEAKVVSVKVEGQAQNYIFNVGISSPDTGCNQYANWWEVLNQEGKLLYRRILAHSHVNEQPFERSGGTVPINNSELVIIRAHMNNSGYGKTVFKGSVKDGFKQTQLEPNFAIEVKSQQPQPGECAF